MAALCWLLAAACTTSSIRLRVRWWLVTFGCAERVVMMVVDSFSGCIYARYGLLVGGCVPEDG